MRCIALRASGAIDSWCLYVTAAKSSLSQSSSCFSSNPTSLTNHYLRTYLPTHTPATTHMTPRLTATVISHRNPPRLSSLRKSTSHTRLFLRAHLLVPSTNLRPPVSSSRVVFFASILARSPPFTIHPGSTKQDCSHLTIFSQASRAYQRKATVTHSHDPRPPPKPCSLLTQAPPSKIPLRPPRRPLNDSPCTQRPIIEVMSEA